MPVNWKIFFYIKYFNNYSQRRIKFKHEIMFIICFVGLPHYFAQTN